MTGIDDVESVGMAPLPTVCPTECAAIAGGPAEVDREEGHALLHDQLPEREPIAEGLVSRATVRVDDARNAGRLFWADTRRQVEGPLDRQPVASLEDHA